MDSLSDSAARILEIEARQDDALRQLEALERRIEQVLAQYSPQSSAVPPRPTVPMAAPEAGALESNKAA